MTGLARSAAISIVPLQSAHVPAAAALVRQATTRIARAIPVLPDAWTDPGRLQATIAALVAAGEAVAAVTADGALVGFQGAVLLDGHGGRWAYTAEVARAAGSREIAEACYAALADRWVRAACIEHVVALLADDAPGRETFAQLGFGVTTADLVRDLSPLAGADAIQHGVVVRRAGTPDAAAVAGLDEGLRRHLAGSPVFLVPGAPPAHELHRRRLADPATATFLAEAEGRPLAFLRIGPCATDVATIVRDPGTASITAAFTVPDRREEGIAAALLDAGIAWARDEGYVRCAVDHETANVEAARFWRHAFTPVTWSMTRRLASRLAR